MDRPLTVSVGAGRILGSDDDTAGLGALPTRCRIQKRCGYFQLELQRDAYRLYRRST